MWFGRIVNSPTFQTLDFDRDLATIAWEIGTFWYASGAMYLPERARGIMWNFPERITLDIYGENYSIDSVSYGETTGQDFTPFAFVGNIPDTFAHVKSALYAIHEFCYQMWLRWEELKQVVSDNAISFLADEISRVESFLDDSEDGALSEQEVNILLEYKNRLAIQSSRFSAYVLDHTSEQVKDNVVSIVESPAENNKPEWVVHMVSSQIRNVFAGPKPTKKAA